MVAIPESPATRYSGRTFFLGILFLLLAGAAARVPLVLSGGRFFIADEGRYLHGMRLYHAVMHGEWAVARGALQHADNFGFIFASALCTAGQHLLAFVSGQSEWVPSWQSLQHTLYLGGILLALAPLVGGWFLYRLAQRFGASDGEAFCAALILSLSNTAFYFSRHLFPYDLSLAMALGAAMVAAGPGGAGRSLTAGLIGGAAFHVYNGYWYLLPLIAAARLAGVGSPRERISGVVFTLVGEFLGVALPYAWGSWMFGPDFFRSATIYARSVVQGLYREGWSFPAEYFWASEGIFGLLVVALPLAAGVRSKETIPPRVRALSAGIAGVYLLWVVVSVVAHVFVINARMTKPLVPLIALVGGWGLSWCWQANRGVGVAAAAAIVAASLINLLPNYVLVFPREFEAAAIGRVGHPKRAASVSGTFFASSPVTVTAPDYLLLNAHYLFPVRGALSIPEGEIVFSAEHPLAHRPYQFDGFTPRQRELLRTADIRMKLIRLAKPSEVPDLPDPALRATNDDWPDGFDSEARAANTPVRR